jgi:hypothetical protein
MGYHGCMGFLIKFLIYQLGNSKFPWGLAVYGFSELWVIREFTVLCKGVIYTIGRPNIQLYMREYTQEMINLMYRAQCRAQIVRI